jgi:hypothetical protein
MIKIIVGVLVATVIGLIVFSFVDKVSGQITSTAVSKTVSSNDPSQLYVTIAGRSYGLRPITSTSIRPWAT